MTKQATRPQVGDSVRYYDYTSCDFRVGTVTAIDVEVKYLPCRCGEFPRGVQIDGGLRRAYDRSSLSDGFDVLDVQSKEEPCESSK